MTDFSATLESILRRAPALPVLSIAHIDDAVPLARALVAGGLPVLEVTLRTPCALDGIARITRDVPGAVVGAGTVLSRTDMQAVRDAGATFAIAPGATDALYAAARDVGMAFIPAIATASELMCGLEHGHRVFKFFPAEASGGVAALNAFAGPFAQARFCPTGGIDAASAPRYLALANVLTVGGSWMVPAAAMAARDWDRIRTLALDCTRLRE